MEAVVLGLQTIADREKKLLAPYAMHSSDSRGRKYEEPVHPYRGPYQRDRDRIVHSAAFRRLSGKMQVFTGDMGDYHRTRLTHTQEVASISRTVGRALRLNEDLVETLALFHDIGHPPFGHSGEDALNECLSAHGGFSHNQHALTIAEALEQRYAEFPGLNLSLEVIDCQQARVDKDAEMTGRLLEAQVVDEADGICYAAHDTDDAVKIGLVTLEELADTILVRESIERVRNRFTSLDDEMMRIAVVHELIDCQVSDLLNASAEKVAAHDFRSPAEAKLVNDLICASSELAEKKDELKTRLFRSVYRHPKIVDVRRDAQSRIRTMFDSYLVHPEHLPQRFQTRGEQVGIERSIGEYIAGMTDRFCDQQFRSHFADNPGG